MPDTHQIPPRISVVPRDPAALVALIRAQPSRASVAHAIGVSNTYLGDVVHGRQTRVSIEVAGALETALGKRPGALFRVDPEAARRARPYLK